MRAQEFIKEAKQATAREVLKYINRTHHEPFQPGEDMYAAVMSHPRWELVRVPLLNLNIPDQEYDDVDYYDNPPESDPYNRVMTVDPAHAGEISQHLVDRYPIVIDADRYIIDGNHRAWAAKYLLNRDYIQAWVPVTKQGVAEGLLRESAIFLNPNTVIVGQEHGKPLNLSSETMKRVQAIAAKHGAWYEGNGADRVYTKGQIDNYVGSFDDNVAKTASPNDPKWLYVLFANVDANNRIRRVGIDPNDTIFNRLLITAKDNSFQRIGFTAQALKKFLTMASEGNVDFVRMSQQPATQQNLTRFLKTGEALMWPDNWEQYPNRAGKIAKAATVDARDQYLASRKSGVYVVGSGHLKAVQQITGKQGVAEGSVQDSFVQRLGRKLQQSGYTQTGTGTWSQGPDGRYVAITPLPDGQYGWELRRINRRGKWYSGVDTAKAVVVIFKEFDIFSKHPVDESLAEGKISVRSSPGKGNGLFATKLIKAGEVITRSKFVPIDDQDWNLIKNTTPVKLYGFKLGDQHALQPGPFKFQFKDPKEKELWNKTKFKDLSLSGFMFVNGADSPNEVNSKEKFSGNTAEMIATRDIRPGEEIIKQYNVPTTGMAENFADGKVKGKSRPGRVKRAGASCDGSVSSLRAKAKKYGGERGKMYHWCANMKSGRKK